MELESRDAIQIDHADEIHIEDPVGQVPEKNSKIEAGGDLQVSADLHVQAYPQEPLLDAGFAPQNPPMIPSQPPDQNFAKPNVGYTYDDPSNQGFGHYPVNNGVPVPPPV